MLWEEGVPCLGQGSYEIGQTIKTGKEVGASEVVHPTFTLTAAGLSEILALALCLPAFQHALNPSTASLHQPPFPPPSPSKLSLSALQAPCPHAHRLSPLSTSLPLTPVGTPWVGLC